MEAHIKLKNWWTQTGADIATWPATRDAIEPIIRRYDLALPEDFHRYIAGGSPIADNWDDEMGNWWPVGRIKNIPDEYEHTLPSFIPNGGQKFLFSSTNASGAGREQSRARRAPLSARLR